MLGFNDKFVWIFADKSAKHRHKQSKQNELTLIPFLRVLHTIKINRLQGFQNIFDYIQLLFVKIIDFETISTILEKFELSSKAETDDWYKSSDAKLVSPPSN